MYAFTNLFGRFCGCFEKEDDEDPTPCPPPTFKKTLREFIYPSQQTEKPIMKTSKAPFITNTKKIMQTNMKKASLLFSLITIFFTFVQVVCSSSFSVGD